ncbi:MAG: SH3 domain-containing protein [Anaerolineales bacterium]|nr:MAG: SH3 domain-containing protein [Anaerolineales bacterium]
MEQMMKGRRPRAAGQVLLVISIILAGCNFNLGSAGSGPRAWIDAPLEGSVLEPGQVLVQSHVSDAAGVVEVALIVNGAQIRVDSPTGADIPITSINQAWDASLPGDYTLEILPKNSAGEVGRSLPIHVRVAGSPPSPTSIPVIVATLTPVPSPTFTPTPTVETPPLAHLTSNANCRSGPGTVYPVSSSFVAGTELAIVGRNDASTWLVVKTPGGSTQCWISITTVEAIVAVADFLVLIAPPTPTSMPVPPMAPTALAITARTCSSETYAVTLHWSDNADNEAGYHIYRDGTLIANLGAGATNYTDNPPGSGPYVYGVEAFNAVGLSNRPTVNEIGCII